MLIGRKNNRRIVRELFDLLRKRDGYAITVATSNSILAYWDKEPAHSWANAHEAIKQMNVEEIVPGDLHTIIIVNLVIEASYQSEERCMMDGYEKLYIDLKYGPVYVKESFVQNPYEGTAESIGYSFATVEGYI